MASSTSNDYELNPDEPTGFKRQFQTWIQMRYSFDENGDYQFDFKSVLTIMDEQERFIKVAREGAWVPFWRAGAMVEPIDIDIKYGDMLVGIEAIDNGPECKLHWSLRNDALRTRENRQSLYGELRYRESDGWKKRTEYQASSCRLVRFKAKLNHDENDKYHKFSYYVSLLDRQGQLVEYVIDPDIKNPSA